MIRKREQNLVWVIRDRGNVSKYEIKIVFAGVTRAVVKRIIVQKSQKKILKSFAALHCPIVRFFGVFFFIKQKHKLLIFSLLTKLRCSSNEYTEPLAQWQYSIYMRRL